MQKLRTSILFCLGIGLSLGSTIAYTPQGFSQYQEKEEKITFQCQQECVLLLGEKSSSDTLDIQGPIEGYGVLALGYVTDQGLAPITQVQLNGQGTLAQNIILQETQYYNQIPDNAQIALIIQGQAIGDLHISLDKLRFSQKRKQGWQSFWTTDPIRPYSINLKYGQKIGGKSIVRHGYILLIIIAIGFVLFKKTRKNYLTNILWMAIILFGMIGTRDLINYISITHDQRQSYSHADREQKKFLDLQEYISFTKLVHEAIDYNIETMSDCNIFVDTPQTRPFVSHRNSVYLNPCTITKEKSEANYIIYYHQNLNAEDSTKEVLVNYMGNILLKK